jgi:hypothetical protein
MNSVPALESNPLDRGVGVICVLVSHGTIREKIGARKDLGSVTIIWELMVLA